MDAGSTVAVTGPSRGIGSAIARELAGRGLAVACLTHKGLGVEDIPFLTGETIYIDGGQGVLL